jgi:hypothetical protein
VKLIKANQEKISETMTGYKLPIPERRDIITDLIDIKG